MSYISNMATVHWILFFTLLTPGLARKEQKETSPDLGIIGGHSISIEHVPFMASLRLNGTYHYCGASIIHEQFVLTAAHCIEPDTKYKVLVGTDLLDNDGDLYEVEKIIPHEEYSTITLDFDICLVKLATPLIFGKKVAKIELADSSVKLNRNSILAVTGWGDTSPQGAITNHLLQVKVPFVSRLTCRMTYVALLKELTPRMICAGGNGKDSCAGDSGGPLTFNDVQVGVASFGAGCGDLPGVYTRISSVLPWIQQNIEANLQSQQKLRKNKKKNKGKKTAQAKQ